MSMNATMMEQTVKGSFYEAFSCIFVPERHLLQTGVAGVRTQHTFCDIPPVYDRRARHIRGEVAVGISHIH